MKKVCVLLPWSIAKDSRAQRTIRSMARHAEVDVYFLPGGPAEESDGMPGQARVRFFPVRRRRSLLRWVLRHSLLFLETGYLADAVRDSGERYDLIYAHDFPASWPARRLAGPLRARVLYDVHDLYLETLNQTFPETAPFPKPALYAAARTVMKATGAMWERRFLRRADLVVTTTDSYLGFMRDRYGFRGGLVLPNYPELRDVPRSDRLYAACGIPPGKGIALYHGNLGRGRNLEPIVRSAAHLAEGNFLVLIGGGPLEGRLKEIASAPALRGKVRFLAHVPYDDLFPLASAASLGLILIEHINLSKEYALANKLTEYMASGVAVLASDSPENRRILGESDAGYLYTVTSPEALGARLNELLADGAALAAKGRNGRKAFRERFHWEAYEPLFERAFLGLLEAA